MNQVRIFCQKQGFCPFDRHDQALKQGLVCACIASGIADLV